VTIGNITVSQLVVDLKIEKIIMHCVRLEALLPYATFVCSERQNSYPVSCL